MKLLNCSTLKFETHNLGRYLWDNCSDQIWGHLGSKPQNGPSNWNF